MSEVCFNPILQATVFSYMYHNFSRTLSSSVSLVPRPLQDFIPIFPPRLRDRIWEWPGDEANLVFLWQLLLKAVGKFNSKHNGRWTKLDDGAWPRVQVISFILSLTVTSPKERRSKLAIFLHGLYYNWLQNFWNLDFVSFHKDFYQWKAQAMRCVSIFPAQPCFTHVTTNVE